MGIIQGTFILTGANIITRLLGFLYRIYMSEVIGAKGMGLYQLIMPVYMFVWSISSSGFSTAVSKISAQENAKGERGNTSIILKIAVSISVMTAILASIIVFSFSPYISEHILGDKRTNISLKIIALCFPFMSFGSCVRGYFMGMKRMDIPALSQVIEQITRMSVVYFLSGMFVKKGIDYACGAAVLGMSVGEIVSFLFVMLCYKVFRRKHKKRSLSIISAVSILMYAAIPLTANRTFGSILSAAENLMIPQRLRLYGMSSDDAMIIYGQLTGMVMPLIMFPSSVLTAVSTSIVPVVSESRALKNPKLNDTLKKTMLFACITGIGASGIFVLYSNELGGLIFNMRDIGKYIYVMGIVCPLIYIQVIISGILNGLGEQFFIFAVSTSSSILSICFIYFLVPKYGIDAFLISYFISMGLGTVLGLYKITGITGNIMDIKNCIIKPVISFFGGGIMSKYIYKLSFAAFNSDMRVIIGIISFGFAYCLILVLIDGMPLEYIGALFSSFGKKEKL